MSRLRRRPSDLGDATAWPADDGLSDGTTVLHPSRRAPLRPPSPPDAPFSVPSLGRPAPASILVNGSRGRRPRGTAVQEPAMQQGELDGPARPRAMVPSFLDQPPAPAPPPPYGHPLQTRPGQREARRDQTAKLKSLIRQTGLGAPESLIDWAKATANNHILKEGSLLVKIEPAQAAVLSRRAVKALRYRGVLQEQWVELRVVLRATKLEALVLAAPHRNRQRDGLMALPSEHVREIALEKPAGESLGITIKGGVELRLPVLVTTLQAGGYAEANGNLFVGDEILEVDGVRFATLTHQQAVQVLKACQRKTRVVFKVQFFPEARIRLDGDSFFAGQTAGGGQNRPEPAAPDWQEVVSIPLMFCSARREDDIVLQGEHKAFSVRGSHVDVSATFTPITGDETVVEEWLTAISLARERHPIPSLYKPQSPTGFTGVVVSISRIEHRARVGWDELFLVLTDHDIGLYTFAPVNSTQLANPHSCYPLIFSRLVLEERAGSGRFDLRLSDGTRHELRTLPVTARRLVKLVEERTNHAVPVIKTLTFPGYERGMEIAFTVDWQSGVWLNCDTREDKSLLMHRPFEHISGTADSLASKTITLRFRDGTEERIQVEDPGRTLFACLAFMRAHIILRERAAHAPL